MYYKFHFKMYNHGDASILNIEWITLVTLQFLILTVLFQLKQTVIKVHLQCTDLGRGDTNFTANCAVLPGQLFRSTLSVRMASHSCQVLNNLFCVFRFTSTRLSPKSITVKPNVLLMTHLQTSATTVLWLTFCAESCNLYEQRLFYSFL